MIAPLLALLLPSGAAIAWGAEAPVPPPPPQISGVLWADYFYNVSGAAEDSSAFTFRRIYFTVDQTLDERFSARLQLEGDGQTVASSGRMTVTIKQACVRWKDAVPRGAIVMGLSPSPLWVNEEALWGYRSLEKTALDLRGYGNASELGVALVGSTAPGDAVGYHLMFSNGSGQRPENNRSRRASAALAIRNAGFIVEPVIDWEGATGANDAVSGKLLAGWSGDRNAIGIEAFVRDYQDSGDDPVGVSVFAHAALGPRLTGVARWDRYDAHADPIALRYVSHYFVFALDFAVTKQVHLIPNVLAQVYSPKESAVPDRDADVTPRLTLTCAAP